MKYPVKLNDDYTCQGIDADGTSVVFGDLLDEGDEVGPPEDPEEFELDPVGGCAAFIDGVVVRKDDGLWVVAK